MTTDGVTVSEAMGVPLNGSAPSATSNTNKSVAINSNPHTCGIEVTTA